MLGGTEERLEGEQNAVVQRLGCPLHICASRIAQRALKIGDSSIHVLSRSQVSPIELPGRQEHVGRVSGDRKSTRLNSSHLVISYAVFCLKKKKKRSSHES